MSDIDDIKKKRTTAKRLFTRSDTVLINSIKSSDCVEIVEKGLKNLEKRYEDVVESHESYVLEIENEDDFNLANENSWLNTIETQFVATRRMAHSYINQFKNINLAEKCREDTKNESLTQITESVETEKCLTLREFEKSEMKHEAAKIENLLLNENIDDVSRRGLLKEYQSELKKQMERCKNAQAQYLSLISREEVKNELSWTNEVHQIYADATAKLFAAMKVDESPSGIQHKPYGLKLQPMPLPKFKGDIREYPRFKDDFTNQVVPSVTVAQQPYVLKSCMEGYPLEIVKNVDHSISEMWKRLDEVYAVPSKVIDVIMKDIKRLTPVKKKENKKFVQLVDIVEKAYRDLNRLNLQNQISNASTVSMIEEKLPPDILEKWVELIKNPMFAIQYDDVNQFPLLLKFLVERKGILEYMCSDLRSNESSSCMHVHFANSCNEEETKSKNADCDFDWKVDNMKGLVDYSDTKKGKALCWIHPKEYHNITDCPSFLKMNVEERFQAVKDCDVCWSCLKPGHKSIYCYKRKKCNEKDCELSHHQLLHEHQQTSGTANHHKSDPSETALHIRNSSCLLQLMSIKVNSEDKVNVLWDGGATLSLITFRKARELGLHGEDVKLVVTKVGGVSEEINSSRYHLTFIDIEGIECEIIAYGIDKISTDLKDINIKEALKLFKNVTVDDICRPTGEIDVLVGFEYAGYHPSKKESIEHLLLLENRFGKCLGGSHQLFHEKTKKLVKHVTIHHVKYSEMEKFFEIESLGVQCKPKCGGCQCGKCSLGSSDCTIKEEKEMQMIEQGLVRREKHWEANYPWIRDPALLKDNKAVILAILKSTERRLLKNQSHADTYQAQIVDMIERNVARKLSKEEIDKYDGPVQYISHHEVLKKDSVSTPCRIVFNSSAKHNGYSLNDYWAKGPDVINNMLGILLRFREGQFALAGDIRKMYHSVYLSTLDSHTHRFLWRDLDTTKDPDTYIMTRVSFGDKPAGTIATVALRKTAQEHSQMYPTAASSIVQNSYIDDILDSFDDANELSETASNIEWILSTGGFSIKAWLTSSNVQDELRNTNPNLSPDLLSLEDSKILGMFWDQVGDNFKYKVKLNFSPKNRKVRTGPDVKRNDLEQIRSLRLTKRSVLSQISGMFDPLGLLVPFTATAKIMMQQLWKNELKTLDWDDPLPKDISEKWLEFFDDMFEVENLSFKRCVKPSGVVDLPMLILFSDASEEAYGTCAYVRWKHVDGNVTTNLIAAKGKVAPIKVTTLPRLELCAAVLSKRLFSFIKKESRFTFSKVMFIVDSSIVQAMIQKESYGFKTFAGVRIGEIQQSTEKNQWYWTESENNISDWITRPKHPEELHTNSDWQRGPSWLHLEENDWPVKNIPSPDIELPEIKNEKVFVVDAKESTDVIDMKRYSNYNRLLYIVARILSISYDKYKPSLYNLKILPTLELIMKAELCLIKMAQASITDADLKKKYKRLGAKRRTDGVIIICGRIEAWMKASYNNQEMILLPYEHPLSRLYVVMVHNYTHSGISATSSKVRLKYWIVKLGKLVRSVRFNCVPCRKIEKKCCEQIMSPLPDVRLQPAPAWSSVSLDLFGPIEIRGEVNKRSRGKAYGVLFNCLLTRAVHIDVAPDYSTDAFLQALRRFMSFRGSPTNIFSDPGSQLQGAANTLNNIKENLDEKKLLEFGIKNGFQWHFTAADAPWQNGCSESLVKSSKRAIMNAIGSQVLSIIELSTVFYECSNLLNERPIGMQTQDISDGSYLCPNDMLLGRATSRISSGPFDYDSTFKRRHLLVQSIVNAFWIKWNRFYFPSLVVRQKWHVEKRNVLVGDIVLLQDSNAVRGHWKLARVSQAHPSSDGKVRSVEVEYKNCENLKKFDLPTSFVKVTRPIQKIVLLLPVDEETSLIGGGNVSHEITN